MFSLLLKISFKSSGLNHIIFLFHKNEAKEVIIFKVLFGMAVGETLHTSDFTTKCYRSKGFPFY